MADQDPSSMFGMGMDASSAPDNTTAAPGNNDNTANRQQSHTNPAAEQSPTVSGDDSRSFFPTDADWPFEASTESESLYPSQNQSWTNPPNISTPVFPDPASDGLPSASQAPTQLQTNISSDVLNMPPTALTQDQRDALRMIAMPHLPFPSTSNDAQLGSSGASQPGGASSPGHLDSKGNLRKRKSSADMDEEEEELDESQQPVKKTAHNMIEKRYRTNLNDKIAALRDSVPSLRIMSKSARGEDTTEDREELHGLTPAHKLNKATVLSKATEYIRHLEKRNNRLQDENHAMQQRIAAFEKLFMAGAMNGAISPLQQPPPMSYPQGDQQYMSPPVTTQGASESMPAGMIQVPEEMKRILRGHPTQPYPVQESYTPSGVSTQQLQQMQMPQGRWRGAAPYTGKLMVGSLAGLM